MTHLYRGEGAALPKAALAGCDFFFALGLDSIYSQLLDTP